MMAPRRPGALQRVEAVRDVGRATKTYSGGQWACPERSRREPPDADRQRDHHDDLHWWAGSALPAGRAAPGRSPTTTTITWVRQSPAAAENTRYWPYGATRSGSMGTAYRFIGQRQDTAGLYFYQARWYDAYLYLYGDHPSTALRTGSEFGHPDHGRGRGENQRDAHLPIWRAP